MADDAFAPYAPLNVLKAVADDVWIVDGPEIQFGYFGLKLPFPTRMTIVRLAGGALWLHSPTQPTGPLLEAVRALGPVRFLIAPNTIHYWWVPEWKAAFPNAEVWAAPGLQRSAKRPVPVDRVLDGTPPQAWAGEIDQVLVRGSLLTEVDFFHRASRTLILTDLIENFEPERVKSRFYSLLLKWSGPADPDGKAPIDMQLSFLGRRAGVREAVKRMIAWDPERVILSHGRWYETNGTNELRRAFRWVL